MDLTHELGELVGRFVAREIDEDTFWDELTRVVAKASVVHDLLVKTVSNLTDVSVEDVEALVAEAVESVL